MLDSKRIVAQSHYAKPEGFDAGVAIALAGEESAQLRDKSYDIADRGRLLGWFLPVEYIGASPFGLGKKRSAGRFG